jgi:N-acetylneuraminic acid mutarotase
MATFVTASRLFFISSILVFTTAQSLICGTLGYHDNNNISYYGGNFFYGTQSSFTICAAYCKQDQSCKGFRYSYWSDSGSQYCEFFNVDP